MVGVKILLGVAALCSILAAIILLWNEEALSCGYYTAKCVITVFIISAVVLSREFATIK